MSISIAPECADDRSGSMARWSRTTRRCDSRISRSIGVCSCLCCHRRKGLSNKIAERRQRVLCSCITTFHGCLSEQWNVGDNDDFTRKLQECINIECVIRCCYNCSTYNMHNIHIVCIICINMIPQYVLGAYASHADCPSMHSIKIFMFQN